MVSEDSNHGWLAPCLRQDITGQDLGYVVAGEVGAEGHTQDINKIPKSPLPVTYFLQLNPAS